MKKLIKTLLREGLLITENQLYNNKIVDGVTKKISDSSDDTINKIAIAGLYRNKFGNIQQVKTKEQLSQVFDDWYNGTIGAMIKTKAFIENKDLATKYLDAYINNIKSLGDKATPFSLKKIETGLVDLVNNNSWIKDTSVTQKNDIYNPNDDDKVYEDENIIILDTNTKAKCVMYGTKESWCITKPELNYYNTYRIKYGATPYFVLQKNVEGNEHKLVIMHYKSGYAIADRSNSGNRTGGNQDTNSPWGDVENETPNLKGLEKYFPYREITEEEIRYDEIIKKTKGYTGDNLQGYIDSQIKGLVINGSQVEAVDFIRDYAAESVMIGDGQVKSLRPEVADSLIESGYFLMKGRSQTDLLNPKQRLRVIRVKLQNGKPLMYSEFTILPTNEQDKYLDNLDKSSKDKYKRHLSILLETTPQKNRIDLINRILTLPLSNVDSYIVDILIDNTPKEENLGVIKKFIPLVKDKLDNRMIITLVGNILKAENRLEIIKEIIQSVKGKINDDTIRIILTYTPEENKEYVKQLIANVKTTQI